MHRIPATVSDYLHHHAPPGQLLGWWLDRRRAFNVLILCRRDGEFRVSIAIFPEVVGHWGHQLDGSDCSLAEFRRQLESGDWEVDEATVARLLPIVRRLEAGLEADDLLAEGRAIFDPQGITVPRPPPEPRRGPALTHEAQFRVASALAAALTDANAAVAADAAARLAAMGFNEDAGPLFVREALMKYHRARR